MPETPTLTRAQAIFIYTLTAICVVLPFGLAYSIQIGSLHIGRLGANGTFYVLALLPGAAAIIRHVVSRSSQPTENEADRNRYRALHTRHAAPSNSNATQSADASTTPTTSSQASYSSLASAVTSALLLTSVFLLVAAVLDHKEGFGHAPASLKGLLAAGTGAYASVVYYMTARMYANALSSRFVSASALRAAFSIVIGLAAGAFGVATILPQGQTPWVALFLVGLFQNAAYTAIRARANTWLGAAKPENEELPVDTIQGIDDTTVDLLREYGIATIQQISEADPVDLSERTLIPLRTIADWMDQAILVRELQRKIAAARLLGLRTATRVAQYSLRGQKGDAEALTVLKTLGQKTDLGEAGALQLAKDLSESASVRILFEFLNGRSLETFLTLPAEFEKSFADQMTHWVAADGGVQPPKTYSLVRM
jgi:hypothetical protein